MSDVAISIENLSKIYRIGLKEEIPETLIQAAFSWAKSPLRRLRVLRRLNTFDSDVGEEDTIWALRDISFEVQKGEVVGIIGRNGAGKSTLLKILSRITEPTNGRAVIRGRVSSLLEVGTGFHPELSGRENVYMNGTILGMRKKEIDRKFDEIVEFSGVEKFLDTPIKRYSSGMKVRLAFAVAAHLEPEILIIDEVLAVGDADFQKKCLGKMHDVAKGGRTVLFVSHNMQAVSTLTSRCVLLSGGRMTFDGSPLNVIRRHLDSNAQSTLSFTTASHSSEPRVISATVATSEIEGIHVHGKPLSVTFKISCPVPIKNASLSFQFTDDFGRPVLHLWTFDSERPMCRSGGIEHVTCIIPRCRLYMGHYRMNIHFSEGPGGRKFQTEEGICPFEVVMYGQNREFKWKNGTCIYIEDASWRIN